MFRKLTKVFIVVCAGFWASIACASTCDQAAVTAANETGIPEDLLRAISRVETGRRQNGETQPWPWTVNFAGEGHFFDDPQSAIDFVQGLIDQGETVIDVGCFQMNVKYHSRRFQSLADMFDPLSNARGAAAFLGQLKEESGNWEDAVGHYHSRTPERAEGYAQKVASALSGLVPANLDEFTPELPDEGVSEPTNRRTMLINYPFLQGGQGSSLGSVVPAAGLASPFIGG